MGGGGGWVGVMLENVRRQIKEKEDRKKKIKETTKAARFERCSDVLAPLTLFIFSFTKHLWICNDVYMHFSVYTK